MLRVNWLQTVICGRCLYFHAVYVTETPQSSANIDASWFYVILPTEKTKGTVRTNEQQQKPSIARDLFMDSDKILWNVFVIILLL